MSSMNQARAVRAVDGLAPVDEVESRQRQDAVAVERGLEGEVEAGERLHARDARRQQRHLHPRVRAQRQLLGQQHVDGVHRTDLLLLDSAQQMVEHHRRAARE